jgi:rubrerythrin
MRAAQPSCSTANSVRGHVLHRQQENKRRQTMHSDNAFNVMREAIKLEINGRSFFEHAAEVTHNDLGKKMFEKLARDETAHLKTFGEIFASLVGVDDWKQAVNEEKYADSDLIDELKARVAKQEKQERASELEAIRIGMELERKAIDFFTKSAQETEDRKHKDIFNEIADQERLHYDLLQAQYDSVTNSGFWFDVAEFRMDAKY